MSAGDHNIEGSRGSQGIVGRDPGISGGNLAQHAQLTGSVQSA